MNHFKLFFSNKILSLRSLFYVFMLITPSLVNANPHFYDGESVCNELVGSWDESNNTCSMTQNYEGHFGLFNINGFTLDGAGFELMNPDQWHSNLINFFNSSNIHVKNLTIKQASGYATFAGIRFYNTKNSSISNVAIYDAAFGIMLEYAENIEIKDNSFYVDNYNYAMTINNSSNNNQIANNTINSTTLRKGTGFYLANTTYNNKVYHNTFNELFYGLSLGTGNNKIYQNNFIDNYSYPVETNGAYLVSQPLPLGGNYYSFYDEESEGCDDVNNDLICDSRRIMSPRGGVYDNHPWTMKDAWLTPPEAEGEIVAQSGGVINNDDQSIVFDVPADSLNQDTTITVESVALESPDVVIGVDGSGTALAVYDFSPDGTVFDIPATLTLVIDATGLSANQITNLGVYLNDDPNGYILLADSNCNFDEQTSLATCTASVSHFSVYAVITLNDSDGDGVIDENDACPAEDSSGYDSDNDGCIDSIDTLVTLLNSLEESGDVSRQMIKPLSMKLHNAMKLISKDEICDAIDLMISFSNQVNAQNDKAVSITAALTLLSLNESIIAHLLMQTDCS